MADNLDPEYLRDLEAALQASREAIDDWTTELLSGKKETEEQRDSRKQNIAAMAAEKKAREELNQLLKKAKDDLKDGVKAFGSALVNTEGGMSKYNASIASTTSGLAGLALTIPVVGTALAGFIKVLGFAVENVTEGNDKLIKAYNDLGEIGATSTITTSELLDLAETAGYGTRNMEGLIKPIKSLGSGLIVLGGSADRGAKNFAELAQTTAEQRAAYRRLGISQEEVTQFQADYVRTTTNAGIRISTNVEKQRKAADEYIETLVTLATLTGTTVKEQQDARKQALSNEALNAALFYKQLKREELQAELDKLDNDRDGEKRAAIQKEIDVIDNSIKGREMFGTFLMSVGDDAQVVTAMLETLANNGVAITTESSAQLQRVNLDTQKYAAMQARGAKGEELIAEYINDRTAQIRKTSKEQGDNFFAFGTQFSKMQQELFATGNNARAFYVKMSELSGKSVEEIRKEYEAKFKGKGKKDSVLEAENARLEAEKNSRSSMDAMYKILKDFVNPALTSFYEALTEIVDWIATMPGMGNIGSKKDKERREHKKALADLKIQEPYLAANPNDNDAKNLVQQNKNIVDRYEKNGLYSEEGQQQARSAFGISNVTMPKDTSESKSTTSSGETASTGGSSEAPSASPSSLGSFNYDSYAQALGKRESSGIYSRNDNPFGYRGKYQFGALALEDVNLVKPGTGKKGNGKLTNPSVWNLAGGLSEFLGSPGIQEAAMKQFTDLNKTRLESVGVLTNKSSPGDIAGYLAVTHLLGLPAARNLKNGRDGKDGFGTTGSEYLALGRNSQMPKAAFGGVVDPTSGGTAVMVAEAGRPEAIVPLKNPDSILSKLLTGSSSEAAAIMANTGSSGISNEMIAAMINKFDIMISYLSDGVDIQQKILRQS